MLEQTSLPFGAVRFQREILVAPLKKESFRSDALPRYGITTDTSVNNLFKRPAGFNHRPAIAQLEKRRSELFALALEAVARAQEAQERCEWAENKLVRVTNQRLVAEHQLRELLVEADQKRAEAEAIARAAEEKAHKMEAFFLGSEEVASEATKRHLVFGLLMYANNGSEAAAHEAAQKHKAVQVRQTARREAKETRAAIEHEMRGIKWALRNAEGRKRQLLKPVVVDHTNRVIGQKELGIKLKYIVCGMILALLLVGVFWMFMNG